MSGLSSEQASPIFLTGAERMSDDEWPFVVAHPAPGWRIVVPLHGDAYRLQSRAGESGEASGWFGVGGRSLPSRLVANMGDELPWLRAAFDALPPRPLDSCPGRAAAVADLEERYDRTDYASDRYVRVAVSEGNLRVAVDRDGKRYMLQHVNVRDYLAEGVRLRWRNLQSGAVASVLAKWLRVGPFNSYEFDAFRQRDDARHWRRVGAFFEPLPERAADGRWPDLPVAVRVGSPTETGE